MKLELMKIAPGFVGDCGRSMCEICWQSDVRDEILGRNDFGEVADLVDQLFDMYCQEGEVGNYYKAILDGSWPTSVEQLEHALNKAKSMRLLHEEKI